MILCKSCGAEIIWARTHTGGLAPFDAKPSEGGRFAIEGETATYKVASSGLHQSHFASCPQAAHWRKNEKGKFK